ncbi:MAG: sulfatase-like hydrolase/transferase, partial [Opitutales bacterium]
MFRKKHSKPGRACLLLLLPLAALHAERPNKIFLDPSIPTFPKLLQDAGYQTVHVGKWHIGEDPTEAGF